MHHSLGLNRKILGFVLSLPIILSSCADHNSAMIINKGYYYYGADGISKYIVVQSGETLKQIAANHNVSFEDLIKINKISPPYSIYAGQHIKLPTEQYHIVKPGETLFAIANRYKVSFEQLALTNNLLSPYTIRIDQKIRIPKTSEYKEEATVDPYQKASEKSESNLLNAHSTGSIEEGKISNQTLGNQAINSKDAYEEDEFQNLEKQLSMYTPKAPETNKSKEASVYKVSNPLGRKDYVWPIQKDANIIYRYGEHKGKFNEGISITAPLNSPIVATTAGEVIYVGNDVAGYGKMVIIKHDNDILSAYAHCSSVLVKKGNKVTKGQVIAKVGKTGEVNKPQLYFSLRKGKSTINPEL